MQELGELVGPEQAQAIIEAVTRFGLQVLAAIAVFVIGRWLARRISLLIQRGLKRANTGPALIGFFGNISYFGVLVLVVIAAVGQLGVQTTSFIAVLGAAEPGNRPRIDPEPTVGLLSLGDSSVNFAVRPWVRSSDYWPVHFALQEAMKKRFDREGISIPFPQRDVHLFKQAS